MKNGAEVSISLSMAWQSEWSCAEADARMMNVTLRRCGGKSRALKPYPSRNFVKSLAYRAIRRTNLLAQLQ